MVSAISAVSLNTSTSNLDVLTQATKARLIALGVDVTNITTESQGQIKLQEAQSAKASKGTDKTTQSNSSQSTDSSQSAPPANSSMESIRQEVKSLAAQVGVSYDERADIGDILSAIEKKISSMTSVSDSKDKGAVSEANTYQKRYDSVYSAYISAQSSQNMLTQGLDMLASYNISSLGLSS